MRENLVISQQAECRLSVKTIRLASASSAMFEPAQRLKGSKELGFTVWRSSDYLRISPW
jgi:hypothetical protein